MTSGKEKTYVFVPGGWHGEWAFDPITERLEKFSFKCYSLTLPGLELDRVSQPAMINLDTHIQFVVDFIVQKDLHDVILCGHSYAGLVIAGAADRIAERINTLVYIDAYVPNDGDSCWSLTSDMYRERFVNGAGIDGFTVAVPAGVEDRRRPHPLATFIQKIKLNGSYQRIPNRTFIYLTGWEGTPFTQQYELLKNSKEWHVETLNCVHNVMREMPDQLTDILLRLEHRAGRA